MKSLISIPWTARPAMMGLFALSDGRWWSAVCQREGKPEDVTIALV